MELDRLDAIRVAGKPFGELFGDERLARSRRAEEHDLPSVAEEPLDVTEIAGLQAELVGELLDGQLVWRSIGLLKACHAPIDPIQLIKRVEPRHAEERAPAFLDLGDMFRSLPLVEGPIKSAIRISNRLIERG